MLQISDRIGIGDGEVKLNIPGLGLARARQSIAIEELLQGTATSFAGAFNFPAPAFLIDPVDRTFKLEVVVRGVADGSFAKRTGAKRGELLPEPLVEFYWKDDSQHDPMIVLPEHTGTLTEDWHTLKLVKAGTTEDKGSLALTHMFGIEVMHEQQRDECRRQAFGFYRECRKQALEAFKRLHAVFARKGHILVDKKLEFGIKDGRVVRIDRICADEFRVYWNGMVGNYYDKEFLRQALNAVGRDAAKLDKATLDDFYGRYLVVAAFLEGAAATMGL